MAGKNKNTLEKHSVVCAITGGIGSGKTSVSNYIREKGFAVISSDENAKKIMIENPELKGRLMKEFGDEVFLASGEINKEYLSRLVFGNTEQQNKSLLKLNSIVHPLVIDKMIEDVSTLENNGEKLIFVESALTYEAGLEEGFDYIITVDASDENAYSRVKERSGLSDDEIKYRMDTQISPEYKKQHADFVIENNGSIEELKKTTDFVLSIITQLVN